MTEPGLEPSYPIETERLLLRPADPVDDVDAVHAYSSLPEVCRYIPQEPRTRDEVAERLANPDKIRSTLTEEGQTLYLVVTLRATDELIGDVILHWASAEHRRGEIGYVFHPAHTGRGFAAEAARAMLGLAFDGLRLHRVIARTDQENSASGAVLAKLGMRKEAVLVENEWFKGRWGTEIDYAMLDREWRELTGA